MALEGIIDGFTQDDLVRIESILIDRRRRLLGDFQSLEDAGVQGAADANVTPSHLAELGSDSASSDLSLDRRASESTEIQEIDDAVERIREGSFGRCESCEKPIGKERLDAIPYARLCMPCKIEEES